MELIAEISKKTHLSRLALYTRVLLDGKIAYPIYQKIKQDFEEQFRIQEAKLKKQRELDKLAGIESNARAAQPIKSTLLISTLQTAYYEGVINEYDFCRTLNIQPDKLPKYLQ